VPPGLTARIRRSEASRRASARPQPVALPPAREFEVIEAQPLPALGHNAGPRLDTSYLSFCWRKAHRAAWKTPPREVMLLRLQRAQERGLTYHEYTAILLDRGER
jgi:hypothetical protein